MTGQTPQQAPIARAQLARLNLVGLMIAYQIPREQLLLLLKLPDPVQRAVDEQHQALIAVAQLLAAQDGAADWAALPLDRKQHFHALAFELVGNTPMPAVPHASVPP
jgi:hypothetical protein